MSNSNRDHTLVNVMSTIVLQAITLLSGFIVPKLILDQFGSDINGLVTSITQFLSYISLIEGGVGSVILANLYKPLAEGDMDKVSAVIVTANNFFKKLSYVFLGYQAVLAVVYPFFIKTELSWGYISSLVLILGLSIFIQYYFALSWRLLLQADKKMFYSALVQGVAIVLNLAVTVVLIRLYPNIHLVKLGAGLMFFSQPLLLNRYIRKHYKLDLKKKPDSVLLSQRWAGFGINVAAMVHASTATVVLTLLTDLSTVSVFSVYLLVVNGLKSLITSISAGLVPTIGNSYAKGDRERTNRLFDLYDFVMFFVSFFCFSVGAATMSSFAMLYTKNIVDANYNQPLLGILLMAAECLFCIRDPYVNMAYAAGEFRRVSRYAYIEAGANILLSVVFTLLWGINGVALGLLISITYRTLAQVWFIKKNVIFRPMTSFFKKLIGFSLVSAAVVAFVWFVIPAPGAGVGAWVLYALKTAGLELAALLLASGLLCCKEYKMALNLLRRKKEDRA